MFERIVLRRSLDGPAITFGEIAEALLFYQYIHIVLDYSSLTGLIRKIGMRNLIRLLSLPDVKTTYIEQTTGVHTQPTPNGPLHSLSAFMVIGNQEIGELKSKKKRLEYILERLGYRKSEAKILSEHFRKCVSYQKLDGDYYVKGGVISAVQNDFLDKEYITEASKIVAQSLLGASSLPPEFYCDVRFIGNRFKVSTNLDFDLISTIQQAKIENVGEYTPAHLATEILSASASLIFAGHYGGDFYTSDIESKIIQLRQKLLLHKFRLDRSKLAQFQELALGGCPSIVETMNNGDRSFDEFMELLNSSRKFKNWLKGKSPDESLLTGYLQDVTASGWLSSIPGKLLRYVIGAGVGTSVDPSTGLLISAGDSFLLDRLLSGWRPNHFIVEKVKPFIDIDNEFD